MTELSDIVAAQNRTTLLLRAFLKIQSLVSIHMGL